MASPYPSDSGSDYVKRRLALSLLQQGMDSSPIKSWTQGAARIAQALVGGMAFNNLNEEDKAANAQLMNLPGLGGQPSAAMPPTATPSSTTAPDNLQPIIQTVASKYGIDPSYAARTAQIKSNFNPAAGNSSSGAKGLYQFIPSTWSTYGNGANITDPSANADAFGRFTLDNQKALTQSLGRQPTNGELYLAHQQGPSGAAALLSNPQANAVDALAPAYGGDKARATQAITANGGSPAMTAGDFANIWQSKFAQNAPQPLPQGSQQPGQSPVMQALSGPPQRASMGIPPEMASGIRNLLQNPQTRAYGLALYSQFAKPTEQYRPMTAGERSQYGVAGNAPAQIDTATGKIDVKGPQVAIDQRSENSFEQNYGKTMAERAGNVIDSGDKAIPDLQKIQMLRGLFGPFGRPLVHELDEQRPELVDALGVEAVGRLVEDQRAGWRRRAAARPSRWRMPIE